MDWYMLGIFIPAVRDHLLTGATINETCTLHDMLIK